MTVDETRLFLTNCEEIKSAYRKHQLLIAPEVEDKMLVSKLFDNINLLPEIENTRDKQTPKFYTSDYNENMYKKSELLAFLYASVEPEWDIIKGKDRETDKEHFYLKNGEYIYAPSLSILTTDSLYSKRYLEIEKIKNKSIDKYLTENNNLYRFYSKGIFSFLFKKKNANFSIKLKKKFQQMFEENIIKQYEINEENIQELRESFKYDDFLRIRQVLSKKRTFELESNEILAHPSIDKQVLDKIGNATNKITSIIKDKYGKTISYHNNTLGNCYALSILYNLYDGDFKLAQVGFNYKQYSEFFPKKPFERFYQHSWLERDNLVYDPAMRIVVPKNLYYLFFGKEDEYTKEDTKSILKRIGVNLTYFRHFLEGRQIGNNESIAYRMAPINTPKNYEEGMKLIQDMDERE